MKSNSIVTVDEITEYADKHPDMVILHMANLPSASMREPIVIHDLRMVIAVVDKAIYESGLAGRQNTINMIIMPDLAIDEIDVGPARKVMNNEIVAEGVYNGCYVFSDKQRETVLAYEWPMNAVWQEFRLAEGVKP